MSAKGKPGVTRMRRLGAALEMRRDFAVVLSGQIKRLRTERARGEFNFSQQLPESWLEEYPSRQIPT